MLLEQSLLPPGEGWDEGIKKVFSLFLFSSPHALSSRRGRFLVLITAP
jgi:hypothetical protein